MVHPIGAISVRMIFPRYSLEEIDPPVPVVQQMTDASVLKSALQQMLLPVERLFDVVVSVEGSRIDFYS
jgi:hypothetical protein